MEINLDEKCIEDLVKKQVDKKIIQRIDELMNNYYSKKDYIDNKIYKIIEDRINQKIEEKADEYISNILNKYDRQELIKNISSGLAVSISEKLVERDW